VGIVEDGPTVAGGHERRRQVGLPHAFCEPGATRPPAEDGLELISHTHELAHPIALRQRGEDRLVPAATDDLHLTPIDERSQALNEARPLGTKPGEEGARVVEGEVDAGVTLQRIEHRQVGVVVGVGDDPAEVADGLVVMKRQGERDSRSQTCPRCGGQPFGCFRSSQ
jgi:hypothetical protein